MKISASIRARDTTISYEELFKKLLDYELFLLHEDAKKTSLLSQQQLLLPPNPIPIIATIAGKPTILNIGARTHVQTLHHNDSPNQIQTVLLDVNYVTRFSTPPMYATRSLTITFKPKRNMLLDSLPPPTLV